MASSVSRQFWRLWDTLCQALMRTVLIEIVCIRFQYTSEVAFTENQEVIQTFAAHTSEEAVLDRLFIRS